MYGPDNFARLQAIKAVVDPDNFFRHAMWPNELGPKGGLVDGELLEHEEQKGEGHSKFLREHGTKIYSGADGHGFKDERTKGARERQGDRDAEMQLDNQPDKEENVVQRTETADTKGKARLV